MTETDSRFARHTKVAPAKSIWQSRSRRLVTASAAAGEGSETGRGGGVRSELCLVFGGLQTLGLAANPGPPALEDRRKRHLAETRFLLLVGVELAGSKPDASCRLPVSRPTVSCVRAVSQPESSSTGVELQSNFPQNQPGRALIPTEPPPRFISEKPSGYTARA
jgi:hypothetical protein